MSDGFITVAQCVEGLPLGRSVLEALLCGFFAWLLLGGINECSPLAFSLLSTPWSHSQESVLAMSAAMALGNFVATGISGYIADLYGRLAVVRPALVLTLVAGAVLQSAANFVQALIARFVLGLVSGGLLTVMPALIAELLPSRHRGFYLTVWCAGWPVGSLFSLLLGCAFPGISWREFYIMLILPALFLYVNTRLDMLPESPRFLYMVGRREEGYEVLLDMYEKEDLLLPWGQESISVTTAATPSSGSLLPAWGSSCAAGKGAKAIKLPRNMLVALWLSLTMFLASAAAQSVKLWMPTMLVAHMEDARSPSLSQDSEFLNPLYFASGPRAVSFLRVVRAPLMLSSPDYAAVGIIAQAQAMAFVGIIACAYLSMRVSRRSLVRWSLLIASVLTVLSLAPAIRRREVFLYGPLIGAQITAQATAINFLQAFTSEYFPTQKRARVMALANFAAQLGGFVVPVVGGFVVRNVSAAAAMIFFAMLYLLAWAASLMLPLPIGKETTLHDVEVDSREQGSDTATGKKRDWPSYSAI